MSTEWEIDLGRGKGRVAVSEGQAGLGGQCTSEVV